MNTNGQILDRVNNILNAIRKRKLAIKDMESAIEFLSGSHQKGMSLNVNGTVFDITAPAQPYCVQVAPCFKTATTFIRKGFAIQIEQNLASIERLKTELNELKLGNKV